jgi:sn-glycerol 3-phosphate transport system permease protein
MEKRARFSMTGLGLALILPQALLIFTFFYWPAGEAIFWAFTLQRPWGGGNSWVGLSNFAAVFSDPVYWNSVVRSLVFALASTGTSMTAALVLALLADRQLLGIAPIARYLFGPMRLQRRHSALRSASL